VVNPVGLNLDDLDDEVIGIVARRHESELAHGPTIGVKSPQSR
jgi:hypothetical protein